MRKGRFNKPMAEVAQRYSAAVSFDWRLYPHDIAGSIAHAAALAAAGIISADERDKIDNGLRAMKREIELQGKNIPHPLTKLSWFPRKKKQK